MRNAPNMGAPHLVQDDFDPRSSTFGAHPLTTHYRDRPIIYLVLRPEPNVVAIRALRRLLKYALRGCGLRCVSVTEVSP